MSENSDSNPLYSPTIQKAAMCSAAAIAIGIFAYFKKESKKQERKAK